MKILLIANHCNTGGITSYLLNLSRGLVRKGHKVWLLCAKGDAALLFQSAGVVCVFRDIKVKSEMHPKVWASLPIVVDLIKKEQIDIVHAQTRVGQVIAALSSWVTGVPFVSTAHGYFKPRFFRRVFPCWGKAVIAVSRGVYRHLEEDFRLPAARISLVYNGIDLNQFHWVTADERQVKRREHQVDGGPVIGIIARLSSVKGIDVLVKAMPLVLHAFPRARLWIVGDGPEKEALAGLVRRLNLMDAVVFKPIANRTMSILPVFDVFVMPSFQEGLGLSVMEAQAAGIPVVASHVGGLPDLIHDGRDGLLVPPGQPQALADKIIFMLKNPQLAQAMARQARLNISEKFSSDEMTVKTITFYEQYLRRQY